MIRINWAQTCSYDYEQKELFHRAAKQRLRLLAKEVGFKKESFDLRSNKAGCAVSGEVTLHHENVYVQVGQSCMGVGFGILIRTCNGRRDFHGGHNHFLPLSDLDKREPLIEVVEHLLGVSRALAG